VLSWFGVESLDGGSASSSSSSMISGSWGAPGFDLEGFEGTTDLEEAFLFDEEDCDLVATDFFFLVLAEGALDEDATGDTFWDIFSSLAFAEMM
jgi:hypothetical protein